MPLSINVGLSRKASKDYQSTGVSINVTAELDQSLLAKPDELQRQVDALYAQAEQAIDRQVQAYAAPTPAPGPASERRNRSTARNDNGNGNGRNGSNGNGHASRNGGSNGNGSASGGMTASQRRAIDSIAGRLSIDAAEEVRHEFGWDLERLSLREASKVIDHLKSLQPAGSGDNGRDGRH